MGWVRGAFAAVSKLPGLVKGIAVAPFAATLAWDAGDAGIDYLTGAVARDENGNIIYQTDEHGNPALNENGQPIPVPESLDFDATLGLASTVAGAAGGVIANGAEAGADYAKDILDQAVSNVWEQGPMALIQNNMEWVLSIGGALGGMMIGNATGMGWLTGALALGGAAWFFSDSITSAASSAYNSDAARNLTNGVGNAFNSAGAAIGDAFTPNAPPPGLTLAPNRHMPPELVLGGPS